MQSTYIHVPTPFSSIFFLLALYSTTKQAITFVALQLHAYARHVCLTFCIHTIEANNTIMCHCVKFKFKCHHVVDYMYLVCGPDWPITLCTRLCIAITRVIWGLKVKYTLHMHTKHVDSFVLQSWATFLLPWNKQVVFSRTILCSWWDTIFRNYFMKLWKGLLAICKI